MKTPSFTKALRPMLITLALLITGLLWAGNAEASCKASFTDTVSGKTVYFYSTSTAASSHFSLIWNFGDKTTGSGTTTHHTYSSYNTTYTVCLLVVDSINKCFDTLCTTITTGKSLCTASGGFSFVNGAAGKTTFTNGSKTTSGVYSSIWDFTDNNSSSTDKNPTHTFSANGVYHVCLTVTDSADHTCTATYCLYDTITNVQSCNAVYKYSVSGATLYTSNGSSSKNGFTSSWNWGDGTALSTTKDPVHTYTKNGSYHVCLTITDSAAKCNATFCDSITISSACSASFVYGVSNLSVSFSDSGSSALADKHSASWDFGDGNTGKGDYTSHTYGKKGTYTACVTVYDSITGCSATACKSITMGTCNLTVSYKDSIKGHTVKFYGTTNASKHFRYKWYFGPNELDSTSGLNPTYTYGPTIDNTSIYLLIYDSATGCTQYATGTITLPCGANPYFKYAATKLSVAFSAPTSNAASVKYSWNFGDSSAHSDSKNPTHVFAASGTYTVCLTTTDTAAQCIALNCAQISVTGTCSLTASFNDSISGQTVVFTGKTSASKQKITWLFGDGTSDSTSGLNVKHTYASGVATENVYMKVYDSTTKCVTYASGKITLSSCIIGSVTTGKTAAYPATVYLITYNSTDSSLKAIDSTKTNSIGLYEFCGLANGTYYTKASLDSGNSYYKSFIPTYHNDATKWAKAIKVSITNSDDSNVNILMVKGTNPGGAGFIGGKIKAGANKTGDPEVGILVVLYDSSENPVAYTYSDNTGYFDFSGIAFGTYYVYAEILGKTCYPAVVVISDTAQTYNNADLSVNVKDVTAAIKPIGAWTIEKADIYPNPVTDQLTVSMSLVNSGPVNVMIYDITGKVVSELNTTLDAGDQKIEVNASSLPAGLYLMRMEMIKNNTLMEARFVKAR